MCPEPAKSLALPADDRVGLDIHQGRAPTLPQQGESDPEQSIEGSQHGSSPLSLEGRELKAKSRILRRHGRMTAKEESRKTKQEQGEGRHRPRFIGHMLMKVKPLSANRILANHRSRATPEESLTDTEPLKFVPYAQRWRQERRQLEQFSTAASMAR